MIAKVGCLNLFYMIAHAGEYKILCLLIPQQPTRARFAALRAGLRRKEGAFLLLPGAYSSARKRASKTRPG